MDNNEHFGTHFTFIHGQESLFDSFKNIPYEISLNFLMFGNLKLDLCTNLCNFNFLCKNEKEIWKTTRRGAP
jgi:hypothetical protein